MDTRTNVRKVSGLIISLIFTLHLSNMVLSSKVWGEVPVPEDLEAGHRVNRAQTYLDDDEDFAADGSGDPSGEEEGSTPGPPTTVYFRALVNFTTSINYSPDLQFITSPAFLEISAAVVDTLESEYNKIPGVQTVNVVLIKQIGRDVFVELDVGTEFNTNEKQIRSVLFESVREGFIANYITSTQGFNFRRLGEEPTVKPLVPPVPLTPSPRTCVQDEFRCGDGSCVPLGYRCDQRADCPDMSDELNCVSVETVRKVQSPPRASKYNIHPAERPPPPRPPRPTPPVSRPTPGPCRSDQATCGSGECISREYLCDGEPDCADGSDESQCGTPSPCEPNEFKCANGRCALKLWRCDGDNDCQDNSDEINCPTKEPGEACAPEQFMCLSDRACIPASYQCDEEPDCTDRSDEYGCVAPTVTNPPEESVRVERGASVTFTCTAIGTPTPIITWRLNWGHIPTSSRISMSSENGRGTLTIRDVKEGDQGAYTCEAINAKGLVFAIPDGVLTLIQNRGDCPDGQFSVAGRCMPCFCFGITKNCQATGRYRNKMSLRFTDEDDYKGVNVSFPSNPSSPPLTSTQMLVNPEEREFQLVDLSRRFLNQDSYWTLPRQFLGNKVDSYGGALRYNIRYTLARGLSQPLDKSDVMLVGNGQRLLYRKAGSIPAQRLNQKEIIFKEENWQHSSGQPVSREDLMMSLANLESINIRTTYDNHMVSVALSDIVMDTTSVEFSLDGHAKEVEECRCPGGYSGLSCESCASGFERVQGGKYLGTCDGCNCNGHANGCDPITGFCLSCAHNTEGAQCHKCRPGYFGDPTRGRPDDCKPCPCPYTETSRRFSDTCFMDHDSQATCDACRPGYTGRRCERCAPGYVGNPLQPNGKCVPDSSSKCDNRGTVSAANSRPCQCKSNVVGAQCDECQSGSFHLTGSNPEGCMQCFCMGVSKQCASSTWTRDQVRGGVNGQLFALSNAANSRTISEGVIPRGPAGVVYSTFYSLPRDIYYWLLPESFRGDKVTAYGGELRYKVHYEPRTRTQVIDNKPDVVIQGNGIFLEHYSQSKPLPRVPTSVTVTFRESAWRRADGQPATREHLLMALADISVFMIRATYADNMAESSLSDIQMDIAVPQSTGNERALEVEECACPVGYTGSSCQECAEGYTRQGSGLYLGTCERCDCNGHASGCDPESGACLQCLHNTEGARCDKCKAGFYGNPASGDPNACQRCPCHQLPGQPQIYCSQGADGQPICDCPPGYAGRRCESCAPGYAGNPLAGRTCSRESPGNCYQCDESGSEGCSGNGGCRCKANVEGPFCSSCKPNSFYLSPQNNDGCLSCFCMGVVQKCSSSNYYRDVISTSFSPRNFQNFALVNRQGSVVATNGFSVELSTEGTRLSYSHFQHLNQDPHYWQMPPLYKGDKDGAKKVARMKRAAKWPSDEAQLEEEEIWALLSKPNGPSPFLSTPSSSFSSSSSHKQGAPGLSFPSVHSRGPGLKVSSISSARSKAFGAPGTSTRLTHTEYPAQSTIVGHHDSGSDASSGGLTSQQEMLFWRLPEPYCGDKVGSYGGKFKYTISYVPGQRGSPIDDVDVQIIGNDITLVTRQPWQRNRGQRESREFEFIFREEHWQRPDGKPATREHLMMVLADLADILIRATYDTEMRSSSIHGVSMEVAVPNFTGLQQALEVEQCQCPPGYQGLSCQDCYPGYTRSGNGLYLGNCEPCDCNGHSDSCDPELGTCTNCQHNTIGDMCESCAPGFFGDPTAGTPEDCQPCACSHTDPDNNCYEGNPQERINCTPYGGSSANLVVRVYPERVLVPQGSPVTFRCQVSGAHAPAYRWTRQDQRPLPATAQRRRQGDELYFPSVQHSDAGIYICTSHDQRRTNHSRAEIIVTGSNKPIEVFIEEPKFQSVRVGSDVSFICTAKSQSPAYTLVWTRQGNGKLPNRAMDFNGILRIQNVQAEDAGNYVCTGSNMLAMDEGTANLSIQAGGLPFPGGQESSQPVASVHPSVLTLQQGQRAELHCTATGNPAPIIEWTVPPGGRISPNAIMRDGVLTIPSVERSDEAEYTCRALNVHGEHTARGVLYVHSASLPEVQVSPQRVEAHEGQTLRLYCRAGGTPSPGLTWKKRGGELPPQAIPSHGFHQFKSNSLDVLQRQVEELQARMERTDIGTLLIPNIRPVDSGTYLCVGTNAIGSSESRIEVAVVRADASSQHSQIHIEPAIATVTEGESLELRCNVPGNPPPVVTWQTPRGSLSSNHMVLGNQLHIKHASEVDSGEYICRTASGPGLRQASVTVTVYSPSSTPTSVSRGQSPIISITPHSVAVKQGESASFKCHLYNGAQPVRLEWKQANNQPLPDNVNVSPDGSMLTVVNANPSNHGTYRCVASNPFGITHSIVSLIIKESPRVVVTPAGPMSVRVGEPINLECQASGEPRASVSWHRLDNTRRTLISSPLPMESNAIMQVLMARPEDSGTYVCVAQNGLGTTETRVEVLVQGGPQVPMAPRALVQEPLMVVVEGQKAILRCHAQGFPTPSISWSKLRAPLPWRHQLVNGSLLLPNVGRQDSGEYICNATNPLGTSEVTVSLDVETPPYVTIMPDDLRVGVGEVIRLQCLAHGTPPLRYHWRKVNGTLPARARQPSDGSSLQIDLATAEDAGRYECVASNRVGHSKATAHVTIDSPLVVRVSPKVEMQALGSSVQFTCAAIGGQDIHLGWFKEGGELPPNSFVKDGILRIENLEQSNEGIYICRANSAFGQAQDDAKLSIQALPKVMINVRTSVQTVMVGSVVEFECQAEGHPPPTLRWSKVSGVLPAQAILQGGMLRIAPVAEGDGGQYRCTATNHVGSVQSQVVLNVQSLPQISSQPETKEVTVGSDAVLPCVATGHPTPQITWSKLDTELPVKCFQVGHALNVPNVTHQDSGTYVCTAANKQGKVQAFTNLTVHERVMPHFTQEPVSFLTLPTIKNAYKSFSIKITFRPDNVDGMILYNGQKKTTGADFISLGLVGGRPEFRFDVGSGMATIRSPSPLKLGEFHTVELMRNHTQGALIVDGHNAINGSSQGRFQGLDLNEDLYVGGHPNYSQLAKTAGLKTGFVGCIRQLVLQGEEVIFKDLDRSSTGVSNCPTCDDRPCQNGGVCHVSEASLYKCTCPRGFKGSNCQHHASLHCHTEACGPDATCINRPNGLGYDCRCHLGKSGDKCMQGTLVTIPQFVSSDSYIAYPPLTNIHNDLRVELEIKPLTADGLMFFSGGKKMKTEDFVAVSMVDGHVELRYELGSGQAVLRSPEPVSLGEWHRVAAGRLNKDGSLKVDEGREVKRSSPGKSQGLNIHTPMFLGGVPSMAILPPPANVTALFQGCIGEVLINDKKVDLSYSFTESRAIGQCRDGSPCERRPCLNQGTCLTNAEYEYQCVCRDGFEGDRCEVVRDVCTHSSQCHNGGKCVKGQCLCPAGYSGLHCQEGVAMSDVEALWKEEGSGVNDSPIQYSAYFHHGGYLALPKPMFPRSAPDNPETIDLEIHTTSGEGLILWQGVELGEETKGKDFISLGLQNGHVVFSYQLGSGEAEIMSKHPINDGRWHKITAVRTGKQGYLQIDGGSMTRGQSQGKSIMVNTKGNIYLGGAPDLSSLTSGKFSSGITGCVRNLSLMNARPGEHKHTPIDLRVHAEDGINVERCVS